MSDYFDIVFFGSGAASGVGPEPTREHRSRRLRSTSRAYCEAMERGGEADDEPREPMGFAIPKIDR